ncbi:hypothetical protein [Sandaracinus amylolyticus]|uniref:hypothetical protein n=1 Tax=Sandaracinus amylolyticus TaxID=927083 RepID=UPI001F41252B|nr:hypothetical protein [Sandaracinus amylolyticus]UJR84183.1 Hypothetical protein I5071_62540 [Sandaracinus amylolyticus]
MKFLRTTVVLVCAAVVWLVAAEARAQTTTVAVERSTTERDVANATREAVLDAASWLDDPITIGDVRYDQLVLEVASIDAAPSGAGVALTIHFVLVGRRRVVVGDATTDDGRGAVARLDVAVALAFVRTEDAIRVTARAGEGRLVFEHSELRDMLGSARARFDREVLTRGVQPRGDLAGVAVDRAPISARVGADFVELVF